MAETHLKDYRRLLLLLPMMIIIIWGAPCDCCPGDQKAALLEFKSLFRGNLSAAGGGGYKMSSWNTGISCCKWSGILCDSRHRFVTELDLYYLSFEPQETGVSSDVLTPLFRLTSLQFLYLSGHSIRGEIPPGIANLTQLRVLHLSYNHFSGPIPPHLFTDLTHLQSLSLAGNSLQGKIPAAIGNATNLEFLDLGYNKLSGEILTTLLQSNLRYLDLQANSLSGEIPAGAQNMTRLSDVRLQNNLLSGEIPTRTWLFESSAIKYLYLGGNNLTLTSAKQMTPKSAFLELSLISCNVSSHGIPTWLANQTNLKTLDLRNNRITGTFPSWLAQMHLNQLVLADNLFQGTLPSELALNTHIRFLDLSKNNFEGEIFPNTDTNKTARYDYSILLLSENKFTGSVGAHISSMTSLSFLDLSKNQLSGEAFLFLCQHSYSCPTYINLSFNIFRGKISISFDNAHSLEVLGVAHNHFSEIYLPQNLDVLKLLDVRNNRISGNIPTSLVEISSLKILSLGNNLLRGSIPSTLFNLRSLQILDLSYNKLRGRVPNNLGNLSGMTVTPQRWDSDQNLPDDVMLGFTSIPWLEVYWKTHHQGLPNNHLRLYTFLDLSNNQLTGELPDSLGNLRSLKVLNFSHNGIFGRIPASFGNMKELESLDLSHNNLSGEIPGSIGTLLQITDLQLRDNNLSGRIPTGPQMDRMNDPNSYANNHATLCGMQIGKSCDSVLNAPTQEAAPRGGLESKEEGFWFSWMTAGIGYPAGFVTTALGMYGLGYFQHVPELRRRRRMMRRRAIRFS